MGSTGLQSPLLGAVLSLGKMRLREQNNSRGPSNFVLDLELSWEVPPAREVLGHAVGWLLKTLLFLLGDLIASLEGFDLGLSSGEVPARVSSSRGKDVGAPVWAVRKAGGRGLGGGGRGRGAVDCASLSA